MTDLDIRIDELKKIAHEEGITLNPDSEIELRRFVEAFTGPGELHRPFIALHDNGNFRATWHTGTRLISMQFRGGGVIHHSLNWGE